MNAVIQPRSRRSLLKSSIYLVLAFAGLISFILGLGDLRRQRYALEQARWHAANFQKRVGDGGLLPLNLEPPPPPSGASQMIALEWPDHAAASALREKSGRIIVARTVPITQILRRDGRAVIAFEKGRFDVQWLPLSATDPPLPAQSAPTNPDRR